MRIESQVDSDAAWAQWQALVRTYEALGVKVSLVEPVDRLPDMVFTANAAVLWQKQAILSRFRYGERRGEEIHWADALEALGYDLRVLPEDAWFEGAGDALFVGPRLFLGYGPRTERASHALVARLLGVETVSLELVNRHFYHLDTCFCPLDAENVLFVREAFSSAALGLIHELIPNPIEVPLEIGLGFACNGIVVGNRIISAPSITALGERLAAYGYAPHPLPISEFMKAGGGVRCLTLPLLPPSR
jgi:N-dimethylarginine dimethylaminohydrolase